MSRFLATLLLAALCLNGLAGCGDENPPRPAAVQEGQAPPPPPPGRPLPTPQLNPLKKADGGAKK